MNLDLVFQQLEKSYIPLSSDCKEAFLQHAKLAFYKKGDVVVREGQFSKKAFLIIEGCGRAYYLKNGKDISDWFTFEYQFMAPIVSFFSEKPSPHYVEFLEDATVLEFTKDQMDRLTQAHHEFERFIREVVTETLLGLCERLNAIQFNKAEDRYRHLLTIYPNITNHIPLTHIASYLGITLETLSRIRNPKHRI
ncbi:CRP-like cAMP-binding protein [Flavobacteriaceae bacterium MAR_2009_75]|nr:CRP-like cAMP-binding protein [Flavobacteriaceae bacterium MAR_2009_75]